MVTAHAILKSALRKARFVLDSEQTKRLNELGYKTAKDYGKLLRNASYLAQSNIMPDNFVTYFKAVNNPDNIFIPRMKILFIFMNDM